MLNHGVPIALGCDDPGIFVNMGLTYDFFQVSRLIGSLQYFAHCENFVEVLVSSEVTGLMTLAIIARHSIEVKQPVAL